MGGWRPEDGPTFNATGAGFGAPVRAASSIACSSTLGLGRRLGEFQPLGYGAQSSTSSAASGGSISPSRPRGLSSQAYPPHASRSELGRVSSGLASLDLHPGLGGPQGTGGPGSLPDSVTAGADEGPLGSDVHGGAASTVAAGASTTTTSSPASTASSLSYTPRSRQSLSAAPSVLASAGGGGGGAGPIALPAKQPSAGLGLGLGGAAVPDERKGLGLGCPTPAAAAGLTSSTSTSTSSTCGLGSAASSTSSHAHSSASSSGAHPLPGGPAPSSAGTATSSSSAPSTPSGRLGLSGASAAAAKRSADDDAEVLLVEDVQVSSKIAALMLKRERFTVCTVTTGEQAVEKFKAGAFKIVLMDINLPGITGVEATKQIRQHEQALGLPPCLVFALTGNFTDRDLQAYKAVNINGCIAKGKLLAEALRAALTAVIEDSSRFVSIVGDDVKPKFM